MKTKLLLFFTGCILMSLSSFGQVRFESSPTLSSYSIGVGAGFTTMYGDLQQSGHMPAYLLNVSKSITNNFTILLEAEHGTFTSSTPQNHWTDGLSETNQFNAVNINGRLLLASIIPAPQNVVTKALSNVYIGVGLGVIDNDLTDITDRFRPTDPQTISADIKKSSMAAVIPFSLGFNIDLKSIGLEGTKLNVNYQITYGLSDYIDGYSFLSNSPKKQYNDIYSILSVGLAFPLGGWR